LFSTVKLRKYSSKPLTGFAWGWTDRVPSTSGSLPSLTNPLALQPSLPIQEKAPVALQRLTALMTPATSWSEPKIIQPAAGYVSKSLEFRVGNFVRKVARRSLSLHHFTPIIVVGIKRTFPPWLVSFYRHHENLFFREVRSFLLKKCR